MPFCTNCRKHNPGNTRFCTSCGTLLASPGPEVQINAPAGSVPAGANARNKKRVLLAAVILLVLAGLGTGAYFFFKNQNSGNDKTAAKTDTVSQPVNASGPVIPGLYPMGSSRLLNADDVRYLSRFDLRIMRNEIYARHGYIFQTEELRNYFSRQSWYKPLYNDVGPMLSPLEIKNIEFVKRYE